MQAMNGKSFSWRLLRRSLRAKHRPEIIIPRHYSQSHFRMSIYKMVQEKLPATSNEGTQGGETQFRRGEPATKSNILGESDLFR